MFSMLCRSENKQIHVQGVGAMKSCYFSIVPKTFCFVHLKKRSEVKNLKINFQSHL